MSKRPAEDDDVIGAKTKEAFNGNRSTFYESSIFSTISWCRALGDHFEKEFKKQQALKIIPRKYVLYTQKYLESRPSEADTLLINLRKALCFFDSIGYQRSAHQRKFHESFIAACIRHIYQDDFADNFVKILEENGWEEARQEVMICCPRRFGKTFATGMYVAAYLYVMPNTVRISFGHTCVLMFNYSNVTCNIYVISQEICIFSPSRRQSEKMLELVRTFLFKLPGAKEKVLKSNKERMWIKGNAGPEDIRKVSSYPSKVSTLKGVGGDLIICEEAAAMVRKN